MPRDYVDENRDAVAGEPSRLMAKEWARRWQECLMPYEEAVAANAELTARHIAQWRWGKMGIPDPDTWLSERMLPRLRQFHRIKKK